MFYMRLSDIIRKDKHEHDTSLVTKKQILEAYNNGIFKPILLVEGSKLQRTGGLRYWLFKKAELEYVPVTYDIKEHGESNTHEWYYSAAKQNQ